MNQTNQDIDKIINNRSTSLALVFYEIALLGYSIYTYFATGELGAPFIIFMLGLIVYFVSNLIYKQKLK